MPKWSEEETRLLKEMWKNPEILLGDMAKVLKSRNKDTIRKKAASLDLAPISERAQPEIDLKYFKKLQEVVPA